LSANAHRYGFVRTVPSENWHWEYRPGSPRASFT
jgi:D-alanyl-D-alanine carboxypeptidase